MNKGSGPLVSLLVSVGALSAVTGCSRQVIPDPKDALSEYADAIERGDSDAVYRMLTRESQRAYGPEGTRRLVAESRSELRRQAQAVASERSQVEAVAEVPFHDGESAVLAVEDGRFRVSAAGALPAGARTPTQALAELRQVLARRSYPGLMRVLSVETRGALERDLRSLVNGLKEPASLNVEVEGDRAEVEVPGGHKVWLKREAGIWRVHDFE